PAALRALIEKGDAGPQKPTLPRPPAIPPLAPAPPGSSPNEPAAEAPLLGDSQPDLGAEDIDTRLDALAAKPVPMPGAASTLSAVGARLRKLPASDEPSDPFSVGQVASFLDDEDSKTVIGSKHAIAGRPAAADEPAGL